MTRIKPGETVIGNYRLIQELGSGAFASVWMARHVITNLKVAVKIITKASIEAQDAKTRFTREIFLLQNLRHPFIAEFFEKMEDETNHYLVIEFAENGNLLDFVNNNGRITEPQARRYFSQLISVLDYLHNEMKVAHRDLKAENVMLDSNNNIRVIDFGLSNQFSAENGNLNTACGSPAYAAPEMIKGQPYTKAADIWSSGILLYSMVAGQLPYDDGNVQRLLQKIVYTDVHYPGFMTSALVDLLKKMLAKNPESRISLDKIKEHYWFSQAEYAALMSEQLQEAIKCQNGVDKEIIDKMNAFGIDTHAVAEAIICNQFDDLTAVYRSLSKEKTTGIINQIMQNLQSSSASAKNQPRLLKLSFPTLGAPNQGGQRVSFGATGMPEQQASRNSPFPRPLNPAIATGAKKVIASPPNSGRGEGGLPTCTRVLQVPAPVQIAARRLSRPVAVRRPIDVLSTSVSHETPL